MKTLLLIPAIAIAVAGCTTEVKRKSGKCHVMPAHIEVEDVTAYMTTNFGFSPEANWRKQRDGLTMTACYMGEPS